MTSIPTVGIHPTYAHETDAGADLRSLERVWIDPEKFKLIRTGTSLAIPEGHFGLVAGRSGLGVKHGISLVNGIGVIDAGYRGEICVALINHGKRPFKIDTGDRIAQLIIVPFVTANFEGVERLDDSPRGGGGFGSTGVKAA